VRICPPVAVRGVSDLSYRFRRGETLGAGARRIAREVIDHALKCLTDGRMPAEHRTHEARKAIKRLRGLVRLIGPEAATGALPAKLDRGLRKTAKLLAASRDEDVLRETLAAVARDEKTHADAETVAARIAPPDRATVAARQRAFGRVMEELSGIRRDFGGLRLSGNRPEDLKPGYVETYRASRKRMKKALATRKDAQLHRWREMVKYHGYHAGLLANLDGGRLAARRDRSRTLEELLGRHHDLVLLERRLDAVAGTGKKKSAKDKGGKAEAKAAISEAAEAASAARLRRRIRRLRREAEREAERLGKALFATKASRAGKDLPL